MPPSGSPDHGDISPPSDSARRFQGWTQWILPLLFLSAPLIFLLVYDAPEIYGWIRAQLDVLISGGT